MAANDLSTFLPTSAGELAGKIVDELKGEAANWWNKNSDLMEGYVRSLAEAAMQTKLALADGRISKTVADRQLRMQKLAFQQTLDFTKLMSLALGQRLIDAVFRVIGWVVFNRTGINLVPHLVQPTAAGNG